MNTSPPSARFKTLAPYSIQGDAIRKVGDLYYKTISLRRSRNGSNAGWNS
ncbi:hypothetical protein N9B94_03255 [Verrucomicrobia bacterium]|nr:hypothetical protein [Verrucomicrobiota bacterium]